MRLLSRLRCRWESRGASITALPPEVTSFGSAPGRFVIRAASHVLLGLSARTASATRAAATPSSLTQPATAGPGRSASALARRASAIGLSRTLPNVPSRRGAEANSVANTACTASTTPTRATNRRAPLRLPSSTPQNTFNRALTRSTDVRPLYIRSNFLVARGSDGNRRGSIARSTRTVLPYDLPALQTFDIGQSQPSCLAGQRYFSVPRSGSWPM